MWVAGRILFGNPSKWGPTAFNYLVGKGYGIAGIAETHLLQDAICEPVRKLALAGYHSAFTPAIPVGGVKAAGGTLVMAKQ